MKWFLKNRRFASQPRKLDRSGWSGALILQLLREGAANDWQSLCRAFGSSHRPPLNEHLIIREALEKLKEAGLVDYDLGSGRFWDGFGPISVSEKWDSIQNALDVSLVELVDLTQRDSLVVRPLFGLPLEPASIFRLFVLMPFDEKLRPVYSDHILAVAQRLSITTGRADNIFGTNAVILDIWSSIFSAKIVIADCTGRNPNVFYEMGVAHALGKPVVLIAQNRDDVPFDVRHLRYIQYEFTPRGMQIFEDQLSSTISQLLYSESEQPPAPRR